MSDRGKNHWLLLVYKMPREPTAGRVYVWRKVKHLGAIALQDAAWVLPATPRTHELFQWLAAEITELGGDATLWTSNLEYESRAGALSRQFAAQADAEYEQILQALKRKGPDFGALSRQFQEARSRDFFQSRLAQKVRDQLLKADGGQSR